MPDTAQSLPSQQITPHHPPILESYIAYCWDTRTPRWSVPIREQALPGSSDLPDQSAASGSCITGTNPKVGFVNPIKSGPVVRHSRLPSPSHHRHITVAGQVAFLHSTNRGRKSSSIACLDRPITALEGILVRVSLLHVLSSFFTQCLSFLHFFEIFRSSELSVEPPPNTIESCPHHRTSKLNTFPLETPCPLPRSPTPTRTISPESTARTSSVEPVSDRSSHSDNVIYSAIRGGFHLAVSEGRRVGGSRSVLPEPARQVH